MTDQASTTPVSATVPITAADLGAGLAALGATIDELRTQVALDPSRESTREMDQRHSTLEARIADFRTRTIAIAPDLEARLASITLAWHSASPAISTEIDKRSAALGAELAQVEAKRDQVIAVVMAPDTAAPLLATATSAAGALKTEIDAAGSAIDALVQPHVEAYDSFAAELDGVGNTLDTFGQAGTVLETGEQALRAVEATWEADLPRGVLYLTNRRLFFEVLHDGTPRSAVFHTAIGEIKAVRGTKEGFLGHEDHLYVRGPVEGAPEVHFHLYGQDSGEWQAAVDAARS